MLRAKWDAIKGIPEMWRKRRPIQYARRVTIAEIWRVLNKNLMVGPNKYAKAATGERKAPS